MTTVIIILAIYMLIMLGIGIYAGRKNKGVEDFLLAGRRLGVVLLAFTLAATQFGGACVIGVSAEAYSAGFSALWTTIGAGLGLFGILLIFRKMKGMTLYTLTEIMELRYSSPGLRLYGSLLSFIALVGILSTQVNAAGSLFSALGIGDEALAALLASAIFIAYTYFGGLWAVTITDFIQLILAGGGCVVAMIYVLNRIGGWDVVVANLVTQQLPENYLSLSSSPSYIFFLFLPTFLYCLIGQDFFQRLFAAKDHKTAVKGTVLAGILMLIFGIAPAVLAICGRSLYTGLENPRILIPKMVLEYMPPVLGGIVISAILAAIMSTADSLLTASSSHVINDFYPRLVKNASKDSEAKKLRITRLSTLVIGVIAVALALLFPSILNMLMSCYNIFISGVFAPVVLGLLWKKANRKGAWAGAICGGITAVAGLFGFTVFGLAGDVLSAAVSVIVMIIVSLITYNPEEVAKENQLKIEG